MAIKVRALAIKAKAAEILVMDVIGEDFWTGGGVTAKRVKEQLDALGEVEEITVRINSPGGNVWDGLAIYNLLKQHSAKVLVFVDALAASAASVIAMAGDKITMGEGAQIMIHNASTFAWGDGDDLRKAADVTDRVNAEMIAIYASRSSMSAKQIESAMNEETWFNPQEAIDAGFADESTAAKPEEKAEREEAAMASWHAMTSKFKRAPAPLLRMVAMAVQQQNGGAPLQTEPPRDRVPPTQATTQEPAAMDPKEIEAQKKAAAQQALAADKARRDGIAAVFLAHLVGQHKDARAALQKKCEDDQDCSIDAARDRLLLMIAEQNKPVADSGVPSPVAGTAIALGPDARDKFKEGASKALLMRCGLEKRETGNEFYGRSLVDLAEMSLNAVGIKTTGLTKDGIARKVLASHSTSDFPLLLSNTQGKVLRAAYALQPVTWNRWCKIGQVSDFKQASRLTSGSFSGLLLKPERGEYKQGTISEEREPIQARTKGRYISLSREMLVNDDLGAFTDMSQKMGRAAARTVEADVYTLLTSASGAGPTMSDTGAFFNATAVTTAGGHANLAGAGAAISVVAIAAGEAAMMAQRDKTLQDYVAVVPRILLCSPAKKQIAWEVVNSLTDVSQSNSAKRNYVQAQLNLEVLASPYLSGNPWYLFADPSTVEAFEVAFLDGVQEPFIDEEVEFMTDVMNMKVRLDYGVAAIDWRAAYRNPGA